MNLIKTTDHGLLKFLDLTAITSETVSKALGVRHSNLMKAVKRAKEYHKSMSYDESSLKLDFHPVFKDWEYTDSRGRTQPCVIMNEDAVKALIKIIDTQEAYNYFALLMSDFNQMKIERNERQISKINHLGYTDIIQRLYYGLKEEGSTLRNEAMLHTNFSMKIRKAVCGKKMSRDELTAEQNRAIYNLELKISAIIYNSLDHGFTAKKARTIAYDFIKEWKR